MLITMNTIPTAGQYQWPNTEPSKKLQTSAADWASSRAAVKDPLSPPNLSDKETEKVPDNPFKVSEKTASPQTGEDMKIASEIRRLINWENHVKQHEQAHMSVGGDLAGGASYSYTTGPDGKRYISGGEVSISIPSSDKPEEMIRILERVKRAALAPADPSAQDIKTASMAASRQSAAYVQLARQRAEKANGDSEQGEPVQDRKVKNKPEDGMAKLFKAVSEASSKN